MVGAGAAAVATPRALLGAVGAIVGDWRRWGGAGWGPAAGVAQAAATQQAGRTRAGLGAEMQNGRGPPIGARPVVVLGSLRRRRPTLRKEFRPLMQQRERVVRRLGVCV